MSKMILATNSNGGIGINNTIPWHSSADFKHFKEETMDKIVIMGFNTWKSLPKRPLPGRLNIVLLSREYSKENRDDVDKDTSVLFLDIENIESIIANNPDCVVIGGAKIYEEAIKYVDTIVLSIIEGEHECDTFFNIHTHAREENVHLELGLVKMLDDGTMVEYWNTI
ncbi:dihydrofolate reductase [Salmonella enterica]|uniref:dihydrofolate reductase n=1 Tax=Salmonella enterica TaxID=28901 RepID=UPI003A804F8A